MNNHILRNANALMTYINEEQQKERKPMYNWGQESIWNQASNWIPKPISIWEPMPNTKKMSPFFRAKSSTSTRSPPYNFDTPQFIRRQATPFIRRMNSSTYVPLSTRTRAPATPVIPINMPQFTSNTMLQPLSSRTNTSIMVHASSPKAHISSKKKNLKNRIRKGFINAFKKIKKIIRKDNRKIKEKSKKKILNVKKVNKVNKVNEVNVVKEFKKVTVNENSKVNRVNGVNRVNRVNGVNRVNEVNEVKKVKKLDSLQLLNEIFKCLEKNYNKEFTFISITKGQQISYTFKIKDIKMGFEITYMTFKEFIDKIMIAFNKYLSYCRFLPCSKDIKSEIEKFDKYYKSKENKYNNIYLNKFKNIMNAILTKQQNEGRINKLPTNLIELLSNQKSGGKKN